MMVVMVMMVMVMVTTMIESELGCRYKNRWSDDEIQSLKKGVARFEKKNKKKGEDNSSDKGRGEQGKKGETEHMWEHILKR